MRKSKFTDSQIMDAVKRVEAGFAVPYICRELGISTATFYKWRAKYGGMDVSMMSRIEREMIRERVIAGLDKYR
jgi:putative transposase